MQRTSYKNLIFYLLIPVYVFFSSCTDVIDVDLKNTEPKLVIEGSVTDKPGPYTVKLTKTIDYFKPEEPPVVSGAAVVISDNHDNSELLIETSPGIYQTSSITGVPGRTYTLNVTTGEESYTATSTMPEAIGLDSVIFEFEKAGFHDSEEDGYYVHCHFTDRLNIEDYCCIKLRLNSEVIEKYHVYSDRLTDGNSIDYYIFDSDPMKENDYLQIEFLTIDEPVFNFYFTLDEALVTKDSDDDMMFTSTPVNPISNISNGALGYFGAFTVREYSVYVK